MPNCDSCGAGIDSKDTECPYCGAPIRQKTTTQISTIGRADSTYETRIDDERETHIHFGDGQAENDSWRRGHF